MHHLLRANLGGTVTQKSKADQISQRLQNAFAISVLTGLTWVFGFFTIEGAKFVFSFLFCVCNSFQGVAVFALFCLRQEDVKKTLVQFLQSKFRLPDRLVQSMTASTGVVSSKSQSQNPYNDMDFSLAKMPNETPATYGLNKEIINPVAPNVSAIFSEPHHEKNPSQPREGIQLDFTFEEVSHNGPSFTTDDDTTDKTTHSEVIPKVLTKPPGFDVTVEVPYQMRAPKKSLDMLKPGSVNGTRSMQDHQDDADNEINENNENTGSVTKANKIQPPASRGLTGADVDAMACENQENKLHPAEEMLSDDERC